MWLFWRFFGGEGEFPLFLTREENHGLHTHKCKFHLINSNGKPSQLPLACHKRQLLGKGKRSCPLDETAKIQGPV